MPLTWDNLEKIGKAMRKKRDAEILKRYMEGASAPALAVKFGLDRCHILKIIRKELKS